GRCFEQAALVDGREGAFAFVDARDVSGKDNHRDGGTIRLRDSWNHVRRATPAGRFRNPWATRKASVRVGHEACRALVAGHDVRDLVTGVVQRVVEWHGGIAWHAKDMLDTVGL